MNDEAGRHARHAHSDTQTSGTIQTRAASQIAPLVFDLLARAVEAAKRTAPRELENYVITLRDDARRGRSLSAAEAVVVDAAGGWSERAA